MTLEFDGPLGLSASASLPSQSPEREPQSVPLCEGYNLQISGGFFGSPSIVRCYWKEAQVPPRGSPSTRKILIRHFGECSRRAVMLLPMRDDHRQ